tara:strand:+ start:3991 stop:4314 length:324 start_codon:yes stop_codon:yes gene_type:complete
MFPKGGMGNLMKQAKEMQSKMAKAQEEVKLLTDEASSGGGLVKVCVNGEKEITSITIDEEVLKEEKDIVEDLILVAVNEALSKITKKIEDKMNTATGGMLGGGFPGI